MTEKAAIRPASAQDAPAIAAVMGSVWHDNTPDWARISSVISLRDHATFAAEVQGEVVGFADSFPTIAQNGRLRWEIDLLAVLPAHRGRGIARSLIARCTEAGQKRGAQLVRALIAVDNPASQRAFSARAFRVVGSRCALCVSTAPTQAGVEAPQGTFLIPVRTLNYSGVWVEGELTPDSLLAAQSLAAKLRLDLAGALVPSDDAAMLDAAREAGYRRLGDYRWWQAKVKPGAAEAPR